MPLSSSGCFELPPDSELLGYSITSARGANFDCAAKAYQKVKTAYEELLMKGNASPVALAYASGAVGSYMPTEQGSGGPATVVYKKSGSNWQGTLAGAGGVVGGYFGGSGGAAVGAAFGSVVGKIIDEC